MTPRVLKNSPMLKWREPVTFTKRFKNSLTDAELISEIVSLKSSLNLELELSVKSLLMKRERRTTQFKVVPTISQ